MSIESDGLLYKRNEKIGVDELQWLQEENHEVARAIRVGTMLTYGLVLPRLPGGRPDQQWSVHDDDDDGTITVRAAGKSLTYPTGAVAIDADGFVIVQPAEADILTLPNDGIWYTIVVERDATQYEPGTLTVAAGSNVVMGVDTTFFRLNGTAAFGRGTKIRIDAADTTAGNAGTYTIDTVVSDTEIHLTTAVAGGNEAGIPFTVAGDYATATPADPDIHQRSIPLFTRIGLFREPNTSRMPICDCKRDDAAGPPKVQFIDRRHQRQWRTVLPEGARANSNVVLDIPIKLDLTAGSFAPTAAVRTLYTAASAAEAMALAPIAYDVTRVGRLLGLVAASDGLIHPMTEDGAAVVGGTFTATGGNFLGTQPTICRLPVPTAYTHIAIFVDGGILICRFTSDAGVTWTGPQTILDPTLNNPLDTLSYPHVIPLLSGRLLCALSYFSFGNSVRIVTVFSDDYGQTWDTNGGVGYDAIDSGGLGVNSERPCLAQDATGRIYIACVRSGTDIALHYTDDYTGTYVAGFQNPVTVLNRLGIYENLGNPSLWISPSGSPVVVYSAWDAGTTTMELRYAVIGYDPEASGVGFTPFYVSREQRLWIDDSGGVLMDLGMSMVQEEGGTLALTWVHQPVAPDTALLMRLTPIATEVQEGGEQRYRLT